MSAAQEPTLSCVSSPTALLAFGFGRTDEHGVWVMCLPGFKTQALSSVHAVHTLKVLYVRAMYVSNIYHPHQFCFRQHHHHIL